jgi:hypothetical protein
MSALIYDTPYRTKLMKMIHELDSKQHYEPRMMHHESVHSKHPYILAGQNDMKALQHAGRMSGSGRTGSGGRMSGAGRVMSGAGRVMSGGKSRTGHVMSARGQLVKKVMKEHGLSLGQASKYIKENNLM